MTELEKETKANNKKKEVNEIHMYVNSYINMLNILCLKVTVWGFLQQGHADHLGLNPFSLPIPEPVSLLCYSFNVSQTRPDGSAGHKRSLTWPSHFGIPK